MAPSADRWSRKTLIDLYNERDQKPWYWKGLAVTSALFLATSFLILPSSFHGSTETSYLSDNLSFAIAAVFFFLSYAAVYPLAHFAKSPLFTLEDICHPHLLVSIIGLINAIYTAASESLITSPTYPVVNFLFVLASVVIYSTASLFYQRRLCIIRAQDALFQQPSLDFAGSGASNEKEAQRRQLLRLFEEEKLRNNSNNAATALPSSGTYKIHWPGVNNSRETYYNQILTPRAHSTPRRSRWFPKSQPTPQFEHPTYQPARTSHKPSTQLSPLSREDRSRGTDTIANVIVEEKSLSSSCSSSSTLTSTSPQNTHPQRETQSQRRPRLPAFFDVHPGERVPSYHPATSPIDQSDILGTITTGMHGRGNDPKSPGNNIKPPGNGIRSPPPPFTPGESRRDYPREKAGDYRKARTPTREKEGRYEVTDQPFEKIKGPRPEVKRGPTPPPKCIIQKYR